MSRVFISNTKVQKTENADFVFSQRQSIEQLVKTIDKDGNPAQRIIDLSGNTTFIIDVHCTFKEADKMQQQGGMIIYRHLLKTFKDCQNKLKVVFYSPISKQNLAALKPENYVLTLLPFVELFPDTEQHGIKPEDWTFEKALIEAERVSCPQFNNAAENLLSGWALAGANKINLNGKRPLVIDDEWEQWQTTYKTILSETPDYFLSNELNSREEYKKLNDDAFNHLQKGILDQYDFIISDLYLHESHDTDKWKTEDVVNDISGLKLFQKIRDIEPAIPVVFHTTSTKFRIYEILAALGADGQIPKNINPEAIKNENIDTAKLLQEKLENITTQYADCWLNGFFRYLDLDFKQSWFANLKKVKEDPSLLQEAIDLIKGVIIGYKRLSKLSVSLTENYFKSNEVNPESLFVNGPLNNLCKIVEITMHGSNPELQLVTQLRNHCSHGKNYEVFRRVDILLMLILLEKSLKEPKSRTILAGQGFKSPFSNKEKDSHPLFEYSHYFEHWKDFIPQNVVGKFERRIDATLRNYNSKMWKNYSEQDKKKIISEIVYLSQGNLTIPSFNPNFEILLKIA